MSVLLVSRSKCQSVSSKAEAKSEQASDEQSGASGFGFGFCFGFCFWFWFWFWFGLGFGWFWSRCVQKAPVQRTSATQRGSSSMGPNSSPVVLSIVASLCVSFEGQANRAKRREVKSGRDSRLEFELEAEFAAGIELFSCLRPI